MKKKTPKKRIKKPKGTQKPASKKKQVTQKSAPRKIKASGKAASKKKPSSTPLKKKKVSQKSTTQKKKIAVKAASKQKPSLSSLKKKKVSKKPVLKKLKALEKSAVGIKEGKSVSGNLLKKPVKVPLQSGGVHSKTHLSGQTGKRPASKFNAPKVSLRPQSVGPARRQKASKLEEVTMSWVKEALQKIKARREEKRLIVKDMEGRDYCVFEDCDFPAVSGDYCRLHYIGRWDYIRIREKILKSGFIAKKIQELLKQSPSSCIMYLIGDFRAEKSFLSSIKPFLEDLDSLDDETLFIDEIEGDSERKSKEQES